MSQLAASFSDRMVSFYTHFNRRTRLKILSFAFFRWQCSSRRLRCLRARTRRIALHTRSTCLSSSFSCWAALAADKKLQISISSSKLQQHQLAGLDRILQQCRSNFINRVACRTALHAFASWHHAASRKSSTKRRISQLTAKYRRTLVGVSFSNWIELCVDQKRTVAHSTSSKAALQEQQLQQSQQQLQQSKKIFKRCCSFFMRRLHIKDAAAAIGHAFAEWSKRAALLRRASVVAKKFVLRYMNSCIARAFNSWAEALRLRSQHLNVAKMISSAHNRNMYDAFSQWRNETRIEKMVQEVCAGTCFGFHPFTRCNRRR